VPYGSKAVSIDLHEIDYENIKCPYCQGGKWSLIKCGCGKLSCSGGVKAHAGKYLFKCPWCGSEGYLEGQISQVTGKVLR